LALLGLALTPFVFSQEAFAVMKTFTGGANTQNFSDPANWTPVGVPSSDDAIIIPATFDVIMDIDFTIISGSITIESDGLFRVPKDRILRNLTGMITNMGFFFVDGKVVNTIGETIDNKIGAIWGVKGDGTVNNGVVINEGTVIASGEIVSDNAKWTNSGTFTIDSLQATFSASSKFTNTNNGILNVEATTEFSESSLINTNNANIVINRFGFIFMTDNSTLENKVGATVTVNVDGSILIFGSKLLNSADLNNNVGGSISTLTKTKDDTFIINKPGGIINNQAGSANSGEFEIGTGVTMTNTATTINQAGGLITVRGLLENIKPGFIDNQKGAEIRIEETGAKKGRISGDGEVFIGENSITNFGIIDISGPWKNFGTIENEGIINVLCGGSIVPLGTIIGAGEFNVFGCPVGGSFTPIDRTMVLLGATETTASWIIPAIVAGIGIAIVIARKL